MKQLNNYIIEKLILNRSIIGQQMDISDFWFGDIDATELKKMPYNFVSRRKLLRSKNNDKGELKNRPWFAVYLYLLKNGPSKVADIRKDLWPNQTSQKAELFTDMRKCNIIKSNKGLQEIQDFNQWTFPNFTTLW